MLVRWRREIARPRKASISSVNCHIQLPHRLNQAARSNKKTFHAIFVLYNNAAVALPASNPKALFIPEYLTYLLEICGSEKDAASIMNS